MILCVNLKFLMTIFSPSPNIKEVNAWSSCDNIEEQEEDRL